MTSQQDPIGLTLARRIDAICDRFEQDWKAGSRPQIEHYLSQAQGQERAGLLQALLCLELELREWQEPRPEPADYQARFPDAARVVADIFQEAARRTAGWPGPTGDTSVPHPSSSGEAQEATAEPSTLLRQIGRFEVLQVLGQGAMGRVYKARDPQLEREVAIKVPLRGVLQTPEEVDRFLREARAAASIRHINICPVHEVGQEGDNHYIVMAYIEGQTLDQVIKGRKEPLPARQAALILRKLALALQVAHDKGIVHRDLKPANILIDKHRKDLVIMDFGLARHRKPGEAGQTLEGIVMGTPAYMAPEQAGGQVQKVGPLSDMYSLGVLLYEMLAGRRPFLGTVTEVLAAVQLVEPHPPSKYRPGVDPALEAICLKAMAKEPAGRYASMKELADALGEYLKGTPVEPTAVKRGAGAEKSGASNPLALVVEKLSRERKAEAREYRETAARHARRIGVYVLAGFATLAVLLIAGVIILFSRTPTTLVQIVLENKIDPRLLEDGTITCFLDGKPRSAEELKRPIELTPGTHTLVAKRGEMEVQRYTFLVRASRDGKDVTIEIKEQTEYKPPEPGKTPEQVNPPLARPEHPGPLVFEHPLSKTDTLEQFSSYSGGGVVVVPGTGLRLGGENYFTIAWPRPFLGDHYRVQVDVQLEKGHWAGMVLNGPGYGNSHDTGYSCRFDLKTYFLERAGVRAQTGPLSTPLVAGQWTTVQADVKGGQITVTIDGSPLPSFTDLQPLLGPLHGWVGLSASTADFRNLRIWSSTKETRREPLLTPAATEKARTNGGLLYELNLAGARDLGAEWWKSRPTTVVVERSAIVMSNPGSNNPVAVMLTKPLRPDFACEVEFEYQIPRATTFAIMFWSAEKAPQRAQECAAGCLVHLPYPEGKYAVQWHSGPNEASEDFLWNNTRRVSFTPYYVPVAKRKYLARIETNRDGIRVFMDGAFLFTAQSPDSPAFPAMPVFLGLRQHGAVKVHALRVYQLATEGQGQP